MRRQWAWEYGFLILCLMMTMTTDVFAGTIRTLRVPFRLDVRALGMGGAYIAAGRNGNAFLYNPALLAKSHTDISIPFSIGIEQDTRELFDFISDETPNIKRFDKLPEAEQRMLFSRLTNIDNKEIRVRLNPMINIVTRHYGLAVYGSIRAGGSVGKGIYEPRVRGDGLGDLVIAGGYAREVYPGLVIGTNLKIINRRSTSFRFGVTKLGDTFNTVLDSLRISKTGFALDLGTLYALNQRTHIGFVIQDLIGKVGNERFPVNMKVGVAYNPIRRVTLAADITNLLNTDGVSLFRRVFMGGEFRLPYFQTRAGFYQGYPSIGAGINLFIVKIDYAFYKRELGRLPGIDGRKQHEIQLKLGWGW